MVYELYGQIIAILVPHLQNICQIWSIRIRLYQFEKEALHLITWLTTFVEDIILFGKHKEFFGKITIDILRRYKNLFLVACRVLTLPNKTKSDRFTKNAAAKTSS